jgi:hypothetical protein
MAMRNHIEVPYALKGGAAVHVSQVARGLDCDCICFRCGGVLVARKGARREHHFAHYSDSDCSGAAESLLHRLAKDLLSNATALALPSYIYREKSRRFGIPISIEREILAASRVGVSGVAVEQSLGRIVPDLLLRSDEGNLILEIAVSHWVDKAKLRHIRRMNIPALELSLTAEDAWLSPAELLRRLVEDTSIKSWLFHPAQRSTEAEWVKARRRHPRRIHTVNHAEIWTNRIDAAAAKLRSRKLVNPKWRKYNDWVEQFNRKHGRYPSIEENQTFERNKRQPTAHGSAGWAAARQDAERRGRTVLPMKKNL